MILENESSIFLFIWKKISMRFSTSEHPVKKPTHFSKIIRKMLTMHSTSRENRICVTKIHFVFPNQISRLVERPTNRENEIRDWWT